MKKYLAFLTLAIAILSFNFTWVERSPLGATLSWELTEYDFGQIEKSKPVTAEFKFRNTGTAPLIVISAKGSCGCTVAKYTKGEILPGEYGEVTATYNAAKVGAFSKTVTVNTNTNNDPFILKIKGEVMD